MFDGNYSDHRAKYAAKDNEELSEEEADEEEYHKDLSERAIEYEAALRAEKEEEKLEKAKRLQHAQTQDNQRKNLLMRLSDRGTENGGQLKKRKVMYYQANEQSLLSNRESSPQVSRIPSDSFNDGPYHTKFALKNLSSKTLRSGKEELLHDPQEFDVSSPLPAVQQRDLNEVPSFSLNTRRQSTPQKRRARGRSSAPPPASSLVRVTESYLPRLDVGPGEAISLTKCQQMLSLNGSFSQDFLSIREAFSQQQSPKVIVDAIGGGLFDFVQGLNTLMKGAPQVMSTGLLECGEHEDSDQPIRADVQSIRMKNVSVYGILDSAESLEIRLATESGAHRQVSEPNPEWPYSFQFKGLEVRVEDRRMKCVAAWTRLSNDDLQRMVGQNILAVTAGALNALAFADLGISKFHYASLHSCGVLGGAIPFAADVALYPMEQLQADSHQLDDKTSLLTLFWNMRDPMDPLATPITILKKMDQTITRVLAALFTQINADLSSTTQTPLLIDEQNLILMSWAEETPDVNIGQEMKDLNVHKAKQLETYFVQRLRAITYLFQLAKFAQDSLHEVRDRFIAETSTVVLKHAPYSGSVPDEDLDVAEMREWSHRGLVGLGKFRFDIDGLVLPSGRLLGERLGGAEVFTSKEAILSLASERVIKFVQQHFMYIAPGAQVMAEPRVVHDMTGAALEPRVTFMCVEELDGHIYANDPPELRLQKALRRTMGAMYRPAPEKPEKGTFRTGFLTPICDIRKLVANAHAEDGTAAGRKRFNDFMQSPMILRSLPEILAVAVSKRLPQAPKPDRNRRAFLDGMIDVTMDRRCEPLSPVVIPHVNQETWEKYLGRDKYAVKMYPYTMAGIPLSGELRALDSSTTHRHPIAVAYRSIITRQPGCRLTHGYNIATDGAMLYRRREIEGRQMAKVLIGTAKSGKSTHIDVLVDLYPTAATGSISGTESIFGMQDFTADSMLAYAQEMGARMGISTTLLQEAIGNDLVRLAVKHGKAQEFRWLIPIIMAGNALGPWRDTSGSMLRRLLMWIYCNKIDSANANMNTMLREDMGATTVCIFTAFIDMMITRREFTKEAKNASNQQTVNGFIPEPDMFSEPAPAYFSRSLVHYSHQVSSITELFHNYPNRFLFVSNASCQLGLLTKELNAILKQGQRGGGSSGSDAGRYESLNETGVKAILEQFRCTENGGMVSGLSFVPVPIAGDCVPLFPAIARARLTALLLLGIGREAELFTRTAGNKAAEASSRPVVSGFMEVAHDDEGDDNDAAQQRAQRKEVAKRKAGGIPESGGAHALQMYVCHLPAEKPHENVHFDYHTRWDGDQAMYQYVKGVLSQTEAVVREYYKVQRAHDDATYSKAREEKMLWDMDELLAAGHPMPADVAQLFLDCTTTMRETKWLGITTKQGRAIEGYALGPTVEVMFHTLVRERDHDLAKCMWNVEAPAPFCYTKRAVLTLPVHLRPPSAYPLAPPCETKTGNSLSHMILEDSEDFVPVRMNLHKLPPTSSRYANAMAELCKVDKDLLDCERERQARGEELIGGFVV